MLDQASPLPAGHRAQCALGRGRRRVARRSDRRSAGHRLALRCRRRLAVRRRGQTSGAGLGARARKRPAGSRRTDQPSRHRRDRVARRAPRRVPRRAGADHPRPLRARSRHDADRRDRSWPTLRLPDGLRRLSRSASSERADQEATQDGVAAQPGSPRAGVAASGRAGAIHQQRAARRPSDRADRQLAAVPRAAPRST